MQAYLTSFDLFGHQVRVTYKGDSALKTRLGAFATLFFYVIALVNLKGLIV